MKRIWLAWLGMSLLSGCTLDSYLADDTGITKKYRQRDERLAKSDFAVEDPSEDGPDLGDPEPAPRPRSLPAAPTVKPVKYEVPANETPATPAFKLKPETAQ